VALVKGGLRRHLIGDYANEKESGGGLEESLVVLGG
jgi:hypothetical protein